MALDAGTLLIRIEANTAQLKDLQNKLKEVQGQSKNTQSSFAKLAGSFGVANIAANLVQKGISLASEAMKKGIKDATDLEESNNKLRVTFSSLTDEATAMRDNLVNAYGTSTLQATELLGATGDLLTGFGFTQDKALQLSGSVQQLAVDLASFQNLEGGAQRASEALTKALLGETESAKSLGIVIRQNTPEFRESVKVLMETQGVTESVAKAQVIFQQAVEQSKNAIGDYARTTDSLANRQRTLLAVQEDIGIILGSQITPVLNEVTGAFLDNSRTLKDWLADADNIKSIQITIKVLAAALFAVFNSIKITVLAFKSLNALTIIAAKAFLELVKPLKFIVDGIIAFAQTVQDKLAPVFEFIGSVFDNTKKKAEDLVNFLGIGFNIDDSKILNVASSLDVLSEGLGGIKEDFGDFASDFGSGLETITGLYDNYESAVVAGNENIKSSNDKVAESLKENTAKTWEEVGQNVVDGMTMIGESITELLGVIGEAFTAFNEAELEKLTEKHELELEAIDERLAREIELIQFNGLTKDQFQKKELADLQKKLAKETDETKKKDLQEKISNLEKTMAIEKANKKAEDERTKAEKKFAKEKYKREVEQFNVKKGLDIASAAISYALGLVNLWSTVWQLGPIAGAVIGGVMTGVLTGIFAANVAVIASKQPPPPPRFARGTDVAAGGRSLVGEDGPEFVNLPRGSEVIPADETKDILGAAVQVNVFLDSEQMPISEVLIQNREKERIFS